VPTYEYQCDACQRVFEVRQRISEEPLTACDVCGGHVRRLISPAPFILKGGGWYVTDYPSEARKKAMESEKSSTASATSPEKSSAEKGSDKSSATPPSSPSSSASAPASSSTTSKPD
jgi:putative FmdB family regulatory protein